MSRRPPPVAIARIDIEAGPALRTALDVLDLGLELVEALPEWEPRRRELLDRVIALRDRAVEDLRQ